MKSVLASIGSSSTPTSWLQGRKMQQTTMPVATTQSAQRSLSWSWTASENWWALAKLSSNYGFSSQWPYQPTFNQINIITFLLIHFNITTANNNNTNIYSKKFEWNIASVKGKNSIHIMNNLNFSITGWMYELSLLHWQKKQNTNWFNNCCDIHNKNTIWYKNRHIYRGVQSKSQTAWMREYSVGE